MSRASSRYAHAYARSLSPAAALIYLHSSDKRQRALADAVGKAARAELAQFKKRKTAKPSGTRKARNPMTVRKTRAGERIRTADRRLQDAIRRSRNVGEHGHTCHLAALTVALGRPVSFTVCLRWLPFWLPAHGDPAVTGLHTCGCADRSSNSRLLRLSPPGPTRPSARSSPRPQRGTYECVTARLLVHAGATDKQTAMSPGAPSLSATDRRCDTRRRARAPNGRVRPRALLAARPGHSASGVM